MNNITYRINSPTVINETIEGESVIINLTTGYYYSLEGSGARIWEAIGMGTPVSQLVEMVSCRYEGNPTEMAAAIEELVKELAAESLIVPCQNGAAAAPSDKAPTKKEAFVKPALNKFGDMQDLLLLDPIHEVDEQGWPHTPDPEQALKR